MNHPSARGVTRHGVDAAFEADEAHKSQLMLEAQLLRAQQQSEAAADKFAEAAVTEERLRDVCFVQGLRDKAFVHGFSAASCWAQAGDFHHAIGLCHALLAHTELPERFRQRIHAYARRCVPIVLDGMRSWSCTTRNLQVHELQDNPSK